MEPTDLPNEKMDPAVTRRKSTEEGTVDIDDSYLVSTGYVPQMQRSFSWFQLFSCAFTVTNSWLGVTGGFSTGITVGGPATLVYGLIIAGVFSLALVVSLGELMSSMPNAGGQYYWAMKLAPENISRVSAYICGICNLLGGLAGVASSATGAAVMVLGCVNLAYPDYEIQAWHAFLVAVALILLTAIGNLSESIISKSVVIGLCFCVMSCVAITVVPAAVSEKHAGPAFIFNNTENNSGWSSKGMAFLVGMINANYAFALLDAGVHLAEEIHEPEKNVPKALLGAVAVGFFTAWPLSIAILDCTTDFDAIAGTSTGVPLLQLLYISLRRSVPGAIIMQLLVAISYFWCLIATQTYSTRIIWAFSRDQGLPFSRLWAKVNPRLSVPFNALLLCIGVSIVLAVLNLASTTAFNSLITGVICFPYISILLPVAFSLLPRNKDVPKGPFNLGRLGTVARVATILYCAFTVVVYSFPYIMPVTPGNMNYFSAIVAAVFIYAAVDWVFRARKVFSHHDL